LRAVYEFLVEVTPTCEPHKLYSYALSHPLRDLGQVVLANMVLNGSQALGSCTKSEINNAGLYVVTMSHPALTQGYVVEVESGVGCPAGCNVSDDIIIVTTLFEKPVVPNYHGVDDLRILRYLGFQFFRTRRYFVLTSYNNVRKLSTTPEGMVQHVLINHKVATSKCIACTTFVDARKPATEWFQGTMQEFEQRMANISRSSSSGIMRYGGQWDSFKKTHTYSEDYKGFTIEDEFDKYVIFTPFWFSWNEGSHTCSAMNYTLPSLKDMGEVERFRAMFNRFQAKIATQQGHHEYHPKAHFLGLKIQPEVFMPLALS
jgi:hypothetical protein